MNSLASRFSRSLGALAAVALLVVAGAPAASADDDAVLSFVPKSASALLVVDVKDTAGKGFVKALRDELLDLAGVARDVKLLKRDAGVNAFGDLTTVMYAGTDKAVRKSSESVLVIGGKFEAAKLASYYAKRAKTAVAKDTWKGQEVYVVGANSWLVVADGYAVVGTKSLVIEALDAHASGQKTVSGALGAALPASALRRGAWGGIVGTGDLQKILGKTFGAFKGVTEAGFSLDVSKGLSLLVSGTFSDASSSTTAETAVTTEFKGFLADPEVKELGLDALLAGFSTKRDGKKLDLRLNLDVAAVTKLTEDLKALFE